MIYKGAQILIRELFTNWSRKNSNSLKVACGREKVSFFFKVIYYSQVKLVRKF